MMRDTELDSNQMVIIPHLVYLNATRFFRVGPRRPVMGFEDQPMRTCRDGEELNSI